MSVIMRRVTRISALASLTMLVVAVAAGCASSHTGDTSTAAASSLSQPPPTISPSPSASMALPSSVATSPAPAPATFTLATPPVLTGPTTTVGATGGPPTLDLTNADANKSFVVPVGTVFDVTVHQLGDGTNVDPPESTNVDVVEQVSADTAAAATTHGVFRAATPGDSVIMVIEDIPPPPCPSGVPSPCGAAEPPGFNFYITIVPANS